MRDPTMPCPDEASIDRYVRGQLPPDQAGQVEAHARDCPGCRQRIDQSRENEAMLARLKQVPDLPMGRQPALTTDQAQALLGTRYRIIRRLGARSASDVFQAVDTVLDRSVAVKFLRTQAPDDSPAWQEARLMSQLNSPHIAQVYEIGQAEGRRYMVMEWVDGVPLTSAWENLEQGHRLRLYLDVLDAVALAHKRAILHRDIKPGNILVTSALQPKVLDFGIALEAQLPSTGELDLYRGTPAYSAPEQLTPPVRVTLATDVYALGILLFELLTDHLPFSDSDPVILFDVIRTQAPPLPSSVRAGVPMALQNICLKCLEKDPKRRYPDAQQLGQDIRRFLRGERVWASPSFVADKIRQELSVHSQRLRLWRDNDLLTQREFDRLETIYDRLACPADPSILESRKLSLSQVCLYLGGWITVVGSAVLFYKTWDSIPLLWRPVPAVIAAVLMVAIGVALWAKKEGRLAVGFLATANLLIPVTLAVTLGQWGILSASSHPWGDESVHRALGRAGSYLLLGNVQVYICACCWLLASGLLVRLTRSSIFVLFSVIAYLALLTSSLVTQGLAQWTADTIAGRYLLPAVGLLVLGTLLDRRGYRAYAWPPAMTGLVLIIGTLTAIALSENSLFGWVRKRPAGLEPIELHVLSFMANGVIYLGLAGVCRSLGTSLQRSMAQVLNWLGPVHLLAALRVLDLDSIDLPQGHRLIYRLLLPAASLGFVFGSVARQMKSFFFSGLVGIAASIHKLTVKHLDRYFAWPVSLIAAGLVWMLASWIVPRWQAHRALRSRK